MKLRRDRVVVVLSVKIYVYRFSDLHLLDQIPTIPNPKVRISHNHTAYRTQQYACTSTHPPHP